jgi:hypothetical protein
MNPSSEERHTDKNVELIFVFLFSGVKAWAGKARNHEMKIDEKK